MRFSANTGFLYKELPFLDRIRAAAAAGFDAVEFHDEAQGADPAALAAALAETGLPVCGLNVRMGETSGCAAIPGAEAQARADIDAAAAVAEATGAGAIHVLSGKAEGAAARACLVGNLRYALGRFERHHPDRADLPRGDPRLFPQQPRPGGRHHRRGRRIRG